MTIETARAQEEYTALRETIRERGTARVCLFCGGMAGWAAIAVATAALASTPLSTLLPLLVLASIFEGVYALHIGLALLTAALCAMVDTRPVKAPA